MAKKKSSQIAPENISEYIKNNFLGGGRGMPHINQQYCIVPTFTKFPGGGGGTEGLTHTIHYIYSGSSLPRRSQGEEENEGGEWSRGRE